MTIIFGLRLRKFFLYSQASTTKYSLLPATKLLPWSFNKLPTITVGSSPASIRILAIIAVVVVLPCAPETAIVYLLFEIPDCRPLRPECRQANQHPRQHCRRCAQEKILPQVFPIHQLSPNQKCPTRSQFFLPQASF